MDYAYLGSGSGDKAAPASVDRQGLSRSDGEATDRAGRADRTECWGVETQRSRAVPAIAQISDLRSMWPIGTMQTGLDC
jgi:hypothetical protein